MRKPPLLLPFAAALLLAAPSARGQSHGHEGRGSASALAAAGIAEGVVKNGVRIVEMSVTEDGFVPSKVKVKKGEKVRLVVTRKTDRTCATEIVVKDHGIEKPLPLGEPVTVELVPARSGEIRYACAMGHIAGVLFVP